MVCKTQVVAAKTPRARAVEETRERILAVAVEVLGDDPDAGMGEIASAAGVVRRTVYGHFPSRLDLIRTLTERAVAEMTAELRLSPGDAADVEWVGFVARVWPVAHRYRVLVALRRGEFGREIHALLGPLDELLTDLVQRGQDDGTFARHLPADVLSQLAYNAVFTVADSQRSDGVGDPRPAGITSLLLLGVPEQRALALAGS